MKKQRTEAEVFYRACYRGLREGKQPFAYRQWQMRDQRIYDAAQQAIWDKKRGFSGWTDIQRRSRFSFKKLSGVFPEGFPF